MQCILALSYMTISGCFPVVHLVGPVVPDATILRRGPPNPSTMVEIPDSLRSLFSGTVREEGGQFVVDIPNSEIENEGLVPGTEYQIALLDAPADTPTTASEEPWRYPSDDPRSAQEPPVEAGEKVDVEIESVGDEGDGIARVDRGYVVIVPGGEPGDRVTVEIEQVTETVGFARIVEAADATE